MRYLSTLSLALIVHVLLSIVVLMALACSSTDIEATVEARLGQERAIEATVEARLKVKEAQSLEPTATPWVVRVTAVPTITPTPTVTPTPKPKPTATRVRPTWTPAPTFRPATPTTIPTPTYAPPSPVGVWEFSASHDGVIFDPGTLWVFYENGTVCTFARSDDYSCFPDYVKRTWELHGSSIVIELAGDCDFSGCTNYSGTFSRETMSGDRMAMNLVVEDGYTKYKRQPECCWNALRIN